MVVERLRARWRDLLRVSVAVGLAASTTFTVVTVANGLAFGYDFFDDVAPTDRADLVAFVSLIALFVLGAALATVAYGALVQVAHEETTPATAVRRATRRALRDAWFAVPLMVICGLLVVFVVPAFAVGPLAAIASQRILGRRARPGYVGRSLGRHVLAAAAPVAALALLWAVAAVASFAPVPGPLSALPSAVIAWTVVFVVSVVVALGASVTATASVVFLEEATDLAPWPPPAHRPGHAPDPWPQRPASVPVPRLRVVAGILIGLAVAQFWAFGMFFQLAFGPDDPAGSSGSSGSSTVEVLLGGSLILGAVLVVVAVVLIWISRPTYRRTD